MKKPSDNQLSIGGRGKHHTRKRKSADVRIRETLMILRRAIKAGWPMTPEALKDGIATAHEIARNGETERDRIAAAKVLAVMHGQNIGLMQELDKQTRLDKETPTEIVFNVTVPGVERADD